jgi:hypothetical protein
LNSVLLGGEDSLYDHLIVEAANSYRVSPSELKILLAKESRFNRSRIGRAGEYGMAQFMSKYFGAKKKLSASDRAKADISDDAKKLYQKRDAAEGLTKRLGAIDKKLRVMTPDAAGYKPLADERVKLTKDRATLKREADTLEKAIHEQVAKYSNLGDAKFSINEAARLFAARQQEYPGAHSAEKAYIAHKTGAPIFGGVKNKALREKLVPWAKKPEVCGDDIAGKFAEAGWKSTARELRDSRLPFRDNLLAAGNYKEYRCARFLALSDPALKETKAGSLRKPHVIAEFRSKDGDSLWVVASKFADWRGRERADRHFGEIHANEVQLKKRLFGKRADSGELLSGEAKQSAKEANEQLREKYQKQLERSRERETPKEIRKKGERGEQGARTPERAGALTAGELSALRKAAQARAKQERRERPETAESVTPKRAGSTDGRRATQCAGEKGGKARDAQQRQQHRQDGGVRRKRAIP